MDSKITVYSKDDINDEFWFSVHQDGIEYDGSIKIHPENISRNCVDEIEYTKDCPENYEELEHKIINRAYTYYWNNK